MENPTIAVVAAVLCIALAAGWNALLRTSPIDPANIDLPPPPERIGVYAHNQRLQNAQKLGSGLIPSSEDLALDSQGGLYTGCGDGWIKQISFLDNLDVLVENWTSNNDAGANLLSCYLPSENQPKSGNQWCKKCVLIIRFLPYFCGFSFFP